MLGGAIWWECAAYLKVSAYGGYEYCSDGAEEKFLQMCEEFNGLNCNKEHLVRYWGKTF